MEILFVALLIGGAIWFVTIYNNLRRLSEQVRGARSNVLAATRKRFDLAQRIADVARSYADHEKLAQLNAGEALSNIADSQSADDAATQIVGKVSALAMAYPDLKANETYQRLMDQWQELETDVQLSRVQYNTTTTNYNSYQGALPQVLFARQIGFSSAPYYQSADMADELPELVTDDGQLFHEGMARLRDRGMEMSAKARAAMEDAAAQRRAAAQGGEPTPGSDPDPDDLDPARPVAE